jgi:hypothetical protein
MMFALSLQRRNVATSVLENKDTDDLVNLHVTYRLTVLNFRNPADRTMVGP